jgi:peptide/nickel transport system permease protein
VSSIVGAIGTVLLASIAIFTALQFVPGDPAAQIAGTDATPTEIEQISRNLGLDRPAWQQYLDWFGGLLRGDLGTSFHYNQSVWSLIKPRLGTTAMLDVYATLIVAVVGIVLGILAARSPRAGSVITLITGVFVGLPAFVAAIFLIQVFAINLGWFPALGGDDGNLFDRIRGLTLPAVALSLSWTALVAQITRTSLREQLGREHVETATGRGLAATSVFRRHVLRNGAVPIVTVVSLTAGGLIAGSVVVERAFSLDGIGAFLVQSILARDTGVVLAISMLLVFAFIVVTTIADIAQVLLDPRLRKAR